MDNFFIIKTMTRTVQKEEPYEYKYLDQCKLYRQKRYKNC